MYEKKLQYPVKIKNPNPTYAKIIISQLGGPDGELGASTRYLSQRFSMPDRKIIGLLTDIGARARGNGFCDTLSADTQPFAGGDKAQWI